MAKFPLTRCQQCGGERTHDPEEVLCLRCQERNWLELDALERAEYEARERRLLLAFNDKTDDLPF